MCLAQLTPKVLMLSKKVLIGSIKRTLQCKTRHQIECSTNLAQASISPQNIGIDAFLSCLETIILGLGAEFGQFPPYNYYAPRIRYAATALKLCRSLPGLCLNG